MIAALARRRRRPAARPPRPADTSAPAADDRPAPEDGSAPDDRGAVVPIHCERVDGDGRYLRWIVPSGLFTRAGRVAEAPGRLGLLMHGASIASVQIEPGAASVLIGVVDAQRWARLAGLVQAAVGQAVADPDGWVLESPQAPDDGAPDDADALVRAAAEQVLAGRFGRFVASHGGSVELVDVTAGVVSVRFHGACDGCPISQVTLHARFEHDIRQRCPQLAAVRAL